ncbi:MAG: hypothetical protein GXP25_05890 [Planctomycetes bacterium]|nr:hypothetical protein [Planctomycetota bacterium]
MPAQIKCPSCGKLLTIDGSKFGAQVKCPACNHTFVAAKPGETAPKKEDEGILGDDISIDMTLHPSQAPASPESTQQPSAGPAAPQGKTCPSCNSPMDTAAVICPNCNLNVMTGKKVTPRALEESTEPGAFYITGKSIGLIVFAAILLVVAIWFHFLRGSGETPPAGKTEKPGTTTKTPSASSNKIKGKGDKGKAPRETRLAKIKEKRKKKRFRNMAEECIKQASHREGRREWKEAASHYREALQDYPKSDEPEKAQEVKKRLAAVEKVMKGAELEKQARNGKSLEEKNKIWDEAVAIYKEAQPDLANQAYVDARVKFITKLKKYWAVYDKAERDLTAGKWEEAKKGFEMASAIADELSHKDSRLKDEKINATNRADGVDNIRKEFEGLRDDMRWAMKQLDKDKNYFGLYAAIQHYLQSDRHKIYHNEPKTKLEELKKTLEPEKPLRVEKGEKRTILTLKDGTKLEGKILGKTGASIKFEAIKEGKPQVTSVLTMKVAKQEEVEIPAPEINAERARLLLVEAANECGRKDWYKVLTNIGKLLYYFGDEPLVQNKEMQEKIVKETVRNEEAGTTIDGILASAVAHCEALCPVCRGKGVIPCTVCKQTGKVLEICSRCAFIVWCPYCGAKEILRADLLDDNIQCRKCKKSFIPLGVKCPYCGKIFLRKIKVKPVKVVCPYCKKRGQGKEFMPSEKMPKASGLIICPDCQGKGKVRGGRCPRCKGRRYLPCPQCAKGHKGRMWVHCPYCKPPDFLMKCPECNGRGVRAGKGTKARR